MKIFNSYLLIGLLLLGLSGAALAEDQRVARPPAMRQPEKSGPLVYVDSITISATKGGTPTNDGILISSFRGLGECSEQAFSALRLLADERTEGCLLLDQSTAEKMVIRWQTAEVATYSEPEWLIELIHDYPKPGCADEHLKLAAPSDTASLHAAIAKHLEADPSLGLTEAVITLTIAKSGVIENATVFASSNDAAIDQLVLD